MDGKQFDTWCYAAKIELYQRMHHFSSADFAQMVRILDHAHNIVFAKFEDRWNTEDLPLAMSMVRFVQRRYRHLPAMTLDDIM